MNKAVLGYLISGLGFIGDLGALLAGVDVPSWVHVVVGLANIAAVRLGHLAPQPDVLTPTKLDPLEGSGPVAGKAIGEAAAKASAGPFKRT